MPKKTVLKDYAEAIELFLGELPDARTSMQSTFLKEFDVADKRVILQAQQAKGAKGMTWNINVSKYLN